MGQVGGARAKSSRVESRTKEGWGTRGEGDGGQRTEDEGVVRRNIGAIEMVRISGGTVDIQANQSVSESVSQ